jgi:hypothetical protein
VTFKHVPQLREFIEAGSTKQTAESRQASAIGCGLTIGVEKIEHGAELQEHERLSIKPGTRLPKKNRSAQA